VWPDLGIAWLGSGIGGAWLEKPMPWPVLGMAHAGWVFVQASSQREKGNESRGKEKGERHKFTVTAFACARTGRTDLPVGPNPNLLEYALSILG